MRREQEGEEKPRALLPCEGYDGGLGDVIGSEESILADVRLKIKLVQDVVKIFSLSDTHSNKMYQHVQ